METPTVKEIITGYIENDMFSCHYLHKALDCFKRAISNYNNPISGALEMSFTDFHKALNGLWMAEVKATKNNDGNLISPLDPGKVYSIESYYALEGDIEKFDKSKFSKNFKLIAQQNTPIAANYYLIYKLRNIDQHDFTETLPGFYGEITSKLNPYILANQVNFISTYNQIYRSVADDCYLHRGHKPSRKCMFNLIETPNQMEEYITIPITFNHIKNNLEALTGTEIKIFTEYNSKYKNTRNVHFNKMITTKIVSLEKLFQDDIGAKLKNCKNKHSINSIEYSNLIEEIREEMLQWKYVAGQNEGLSKMIQNQDSFISRYLENYCYPNPKTVAREIYSKNKNIFNPSIFESLTEEQIINNIYNKVLKVKEEIISKNSNGSNKYWIVSWDDKLHYNRAFLSISEKSDIMQKLLNKYKV